MWLEISKIVFKNCRSVRVLVSCATFYTKTENLLRCLWVIRFLTALRHVGVNFWDLYSLIEVDLNETRAWYWENKSLQRLLNCCFLCCVGGVRRNRVLKTFFGFSFFACICWLSWIRFCCLRLNSDCKRGAVGRKKRNTHYLACDCYVYYWRLSKLRKLIYYYKLFALIYSKPILIYNSRQCIKLNIIDNLFAASNRLNKLWPSWIFIISYYLLII